MVRRGTDQAVRYQVVEGENQPAGLERNLDTVHWRRHSLGDGQHAHRDKRAILAAITLLSVRTAGHITRHCGHIAHLGGSQAVRPRWRHQWRKDESDDHEDREQTTDESAEVHIVPSHGAVIL